jgi:hypothetical protein
VSGDAFALRWELAEFLAGWHASGYVSLGSARRFGRRVRVLARRAGLSVAEVRRGLELDAAAMNEAE